ncbi:MAG: PD40 domain-containing protein [Bacteroidetes bacterium]|nr:PD40 domain-containing protein [Bacteroidota bacterium]MBS1649307.1 PD40 domain-containing protein [Bacteroidota bacterium]
MKKIVFIILLLIVKNNYAQIYNPNNINEKTVKLYETALVKLADGDIKNAIAILKECIEANENYIDAYLSLAGAYGELKNYSTAVSTYEIARNKDTTYFQPYLLPYSINLAGLGKFEEALNAVNQFLSIQGLNDRSLKAAAYRKRCYQFAIQYKQNHSNNNYQFNPINLGDSVNTQYLEYSPTVSIDDSLLVFTRRINGREDFYQSIIHAKKISQAKKIEGDINNEPYKGALTISSDGEFLIFAGNFRNGMGNYDLYISYWTPQGWSEPENLGPNVNTEYWESTPSLSPDNRVLYFSSDRPGGIGGKDLYISFKQSNGRFGPAKNMGPLINSVGDEIAPYIHSDNQTLYFSSNGLPGYGNEDLFICRKDSLGLWSKPENLGYPINTIDNEGSIAVSSDGSTAYYASDRSDTRGGLDLYMFNLRSDIRPHKTLYVKGRVYDAKTQKGIPSSVELIDNSNNNTLIKIQTDELGKYFVPLPFGADYTFIVNRKGYLFYTELYQLSKKQADSTYKKDIPLEPIELNSKLVFKNIQFESNSSELKSISLIELDKLLLLMQENPTLTIQINGHTDNTGNEANNQTLSSARAKAVANYLFIKGIASNRLKYKGYGATQPIADNNTEEGKAKNRRTEMIVTSL